MFVIAPDSLQDRHGIHIHRRQPRVVSELAGDPPVEHHEHRIISALHQKIDDDPGVLAGLANLVDQNAPRYIAPAHEVVDRAEMRLVLRSQFQRVVGVPRFVLHLDPIEIPDLAGHSPDLKRDEGCQQRQRQTGRLDRKGPVERRLTKACSFADPVEQFGLGAGHPYLSAPRQPIEQRAPPAGVEMRGDLVEQQDRCAAGAVGDQLGMGEDNAQQQRLLLPRSSRVAQAALCRGA
ncbi:hypothetical protein DdX_21459 [Ditylenchus destructor]|uniref:Uncharacterized protein n=1 Tax=Ditylenchus destructor TaxID=166010 RepID=A0AAD4MGF9_9BILA|nr:hypothetical protein DdX_21459 [Ditylenchus destructor]